MSKSPSPEKVTTSAGISYCRYDLNDRKTLDFLAPCDVTAGECCAVGNFFGRVIEDAKQGERMVLSFNEVSLFKLNGLTSIPNNGDPLYYKQETKTFSINKPSSEGEGFIFAGLYYVDLNLPAPQETNNPEGYVVIPPAGSSF